MEKIASFTIDHTVLQKGMYISRIDADCVTYDIRTKKPNKESVMPNGAIHTVEHLFATFVRNSDIRDSVIYFGPMGCRTGFYFITRDSVPAEKAIDITKEAFEFCLHFEGEIPGASEKECGNFRDHDLAGAKQIAEDMIKVLDGWTAEKLRYPS